MGIVSSSQASDEIEQAYDAIKTGDIRKVEIFLEKKDHLDLEKILRSGVKPLLYACMYHENCPDILVSILQKYGHDGQISESIAVKDAFMLCCARGYTAAATTFLDNGVDVNTGGLTVSNLRNQKVAGGRHEVTAMGLACGSNHLEIAKLLIDYGIDLNVAVNKAGMNALELCANKGRYRIMKLLLEGGCDTSTSSYGYKTALHLASTFYIKAVAADMVSILLDQGMDADIRIDNTGACCSDTALQCCMDARDEQIVRALLDHGADPLVCLNDQQMRPPNMQALLIEAADNIDSIPILK